MSDTDKKVFRYNGYSIPTNLVILTGGDTKSWKFISQSHVEMYRKYTPLNDSDFVLEIGCGVGRDAIELTQILGPKGKYVGIDIIKPSIDWCKKNISTKYKNFKFYYHDIQSQIHNSAGSLRTTDIKLPLADNSVDRIVLHSVFTHMFEKDIVYYLKEFNRVLKSDGLVLASFFVLNERALGAAHKGRGKKHLHPLTFKFELTDGCYINDEQYPEGAVGYKPDKLKSMLRKSGFIIHGGHVHRGSWFGIKDASNGQDIVVLRKGSRREVLAQLSKPLKFTNR